MPRTVFSYMAGARWIRRRFHDNGQLAFVSSATTVARIGRKLARPEEAARGRLGIKGGLLASRQKPKVCYLITLYHKFAQVLRLVRRLSGTGSAFALHIDSAADPNRVAWFRSQLKDIGAVAYAPSTRSAWGSYNAALANIRCIQTALAMGPFDRYVLLSGQDYPIAADAQVSEFFSASKDVEYLEAFPRDVMDETAFGWTLLSVSEVSSVATEPPDRVASAP